MDLFYLLPRQIDSVNARATIDGDEFHHLVRVLRCREGDVVPVTDGAGLSAEMVIGVVGKHMAVGTLGECRFVPPPETRVTVAMSLLKLPQRFDFFLEKATELGVDEIIPMVTQRTVSTPGEGRIERKAERWLNIMHSAARQSRRFHLPSLSKPLPFREMLTRGGYDLRFIAHESEKGSPSFEPTGKRLLFLVGGEGGFTDAECAAAVQAGFLPISLGSSVLRAETAGIFTVAMVRARLLMTATLSARL